MLQGRTAWRRDGRRLFLIFAGASLTVVALLGVVLAHGFEMEARDGGLKQARAQAAVIEEMAIAPAVRGADFTAGLSAYELSRLREATDLAIYNGSIVRLRVRSFGGQVLFSDDGSTVDAVPVSDPAFRRAVTGLSDASIVADPNGGPDSTIRVVQPIVAKASGQSAGVLELHLPYRAIAEHTRAQIERTYWRLAGGLAALYLVLALIAWSNTRALRRFAAQHQHDALHDPLTGLPNRKLFRHSATQATQRGQKGEPGAIVLIDLDHFKEVNDTLGHHAGDELLCVVAQRLTAALRTDDVVARLGGDEFGLILPRITDVALARELLTEVSRTLGEEFMVGSVAMTIEASFGIALYPQHTDDLETLLQYADAAMYQAKRQGAGIVVHEVTDTPRLGHGLGLKAEVRHAVEQDELVLHYQPKLELATGQVGGVEALVRWAHPTRGLLGPAHFLPVVQDCGLIDSLTTWVLRRALTDQRAWTALGWEWPVSVNVSARNLDRPGFPDQVLALLEEHGVSADKLCIEVTETAIALDTKLAVQSLRAMAERGIAISIDDFGTGYTSLSQLRHLPVAEVKIDRGFIMDLDSDAKDRAIVRSVIELAHGIGAKVTAEGVEKASGVDWLTEAGCDLAQGYLFAKPMPWTRLVSEYSCTTAASPLTGNGPTDSIERTLL